MITLFRFLAFVLLGYAIIGLLINKYVVKPDRKKFPFTTPSIPIGLFFAFLSLWIVVIGPQEVGVEISPSGIQEEILTTGWNFVPPWNKVEPMDRTVWVYTFSNKFNDGQESGADAIWAPTIEGIKLGFDVSISWSIDPNYAPWILQNVSEVDGDDDAKYRWIEKNFIRSKAKSAIALATSHFTPVEAYSNKREELQQLAYNKLKDELNVYHLILGQVDVRDVFYNREYEQSINAKKLAEQEALRLIEITKQKQEKLIQAKIDKDIEITTAEGASQALKIKGEAITSNPKIIQLEWIQRWDGQLPQYMLGEGGGTMLMLPNK